ncbi:hypothetical protein [Niveibacterium terrae]|uniref:hypothetical protein n=1 Tax=Niveibacterium terrae TaxID=3373598 RepID=UPI003A940823
MNSSTQDSAFGAEAGRQLPFSETLDSAELAPVALRASLADWLERHTPVCPMIFTPAFSTTGLSCPASVFVVSSGHWLWLAEEEDGTVRICTAAHSAIRSIELTQVLLQGCLQVFAANARAKILFNVVGMEFFVAAVQKMLDAAPAVPVEQRGSEVAPSSLGGLSFKLRSTLTDFVGARHPLRRITSWSQACFAGRTIPGGLLALTDRHLCLLREGLPSGEDEAAERDLSSYGKEIVYLNRFSTISWTCELGENLATLAISVAGTAVLEFEVPETDLAEVEALLNASVV